MQLEFVNVFFGRRSLGIFLDGGSWDSAYFNRNKSHYQIVRDRLKSLLESRVYAHNYVDLVGLHWFDDSNQVSFCFQVVDDFGNKAMTDFYVMPRKSACVGSRISQVSNN